MKMKFTLLAAAVAMLSFSASAQTYSMLVETNPGLEEECDLTKCLTLSNSTSVNEAKKKLPGLQGVGTASHKNLLIAGTDFAHNIYGEYGPEGTSLAETIGVYADGSQPYVRFRYNTGNKARYRSVAGSRMINALKKECHRGVNTAWIKLYVGPKPADATSDVLTPKMVFCANTDAKMDGTDALVLTFPAITLTDEPQTVFVDTKEVAGDLLTNDFKNTETGDDINTAYVDFYVDGVSKGQFLAYEAFGFGRVHDVPKVGFNTQTYRELGFRGMKYPTLPGTIYIQAEDFDAPKAGEPLNRSEFCVGLDAYTDAYGYTMMPSKVSYWSKGDLSNVRIDAAQNKTGYGIFQTFSDGKGKDCDEYSSQNAGLGFALIGMSRMNAGAGTQYGGEYLDETSNLISFEQALDGFGSWFEYTFEMEEDGYVDISLAVTTHTAMPYQQVLTAGEYRAVTNEYVTNYNKPREEGGYVVEGLDDDFLKLYGFSYLVSVDGEECLTNWDSRPMPGKNNGAIELGTWQNPLKWTNNQEIDADGNAVNSKFLLAMPTYAAFDGGAQWWPLYRNEQIWELYDMKINEGQDNEEPSQFRVQCDELGENYFKDNYANRPDFADIPCKAGKHTIRVRSTGGVTIFDEIRIRAKKEQEYTNSGIKAVRNIIETEADAPAEYFDLQGRRVMNPANGLYIVKRGEKVTKEVIR